jgi:uncharacterized membrane protein YjjB (DUF3815 family)
VAGFFFIFVFLRFFCVFCDLPLTTLRVTNFPGACGAVGAPRGTNYITTNKAHANYAWPRAWLR